MTKHTSGPWQVQDYPPDVLEIRIIHSRGTDQLRTYDTVALVPIHSVQGVDEAQANARLIAAAPELLETLRVALAYAAIHEHQDRQTRADCAAIRAAIAKAEGK